MQRLENKAGRETVETQFLCSRTVVLNLLGLWARWAAWGCGVGWIGPPGQDRVLQCLHPTYIQGWEPVLPPPSPCMLGLSPMLPGYVWPCMPWLGPTPPCWPDPACWVMLCGPWGSLQVWIFDSTAPLPPNFQACGEPEGGAYYWKDNKYLKQD